ncbi:MULTISPECIES: hypothetical protein [unclassified Pseudomonas]|uniref:hypothetical protein n=1 Tax=unclassified Pseudomonas TaxID=196821 RepID=UPI00257B0932|nr:MULTISPECIES: hypothetical protein [unclassified Pseudomonas]
MPIQESCECCGDNLKAGQTGECDFCHDEGLLIDLCGGLDTQAYQMVEEKRRRGDGARFNPVTIRMTARLDKTYSGKFLVCFEGDKLPTLRLAGCPLLAKCGSHLSMNTV